MDVAQGGIVDGRVLDVLERDGPQRGWRCGGAQEFLEDTDDVVPYGPTGLIRVTLKDQTQMFEVGAVF